MPSGSGETSVETRVRVQIVHNGESFEARGRVVHILEVDGDGIVFTKVEEQSQRILDNWIAVLRDKKKSRQIVSTQWPRQTN